MADQKNGISYLQPDGKTWNVCTGCSPVSSGCRSCWAKGMVRRIEAAQLATSPKITEATVTSTGQWNGNVCLRPDWLSKPLRWRKPRVVLVQTLGDLFHDGVPFSFIAAVYGVMAACPQHTFLLLTKRPERMLEFYRWVEAEYRRKAGPWVSSTPRRCALEHGVRLGDEPRHGVPWPLANAVLGISAENQAELAKRWAVLRQVQAARYWWSLEPLLGPLDFSGDVGAGVAPSFVAVGAETGPRARPCDVEHIRSVVRRCQSAGVRVHVKAVPVGGKPSKKPEEWAEDLRVQDEVPRG